MFILNTLKNAPTCFDLIQIILRELVYSLLKSLILKFVKNVRRTSPNRAHVSTPCDMLPHHHTNFLHF